MDMIVHNYEILQSNTKHHFHNTFIFKKHTNNQSNEESFILWK